MNQPEGTNMETQAFNRNIAMDLAESVAVDKHYVNLTNGIFQIEKNPQHCTFIRIQSTACEQKRWQEIILNLSDDLLLNLALGNTCYVYDCGAHKKVSRAIWQGLEWIKYALNAVWFERDYTPVGRTATAGEYFALCLTKLSNPARNKLKYYRKFLNCTEIDLVGVCESTECDGDYYTAKRLLVEGTLTDGT